VAIGAALAVILGALALAAISQDRASAHRGGGDADTVFLNGKVLLYPKTDNLLSDGVKWARAVAVEDGVITYVGGNHRARKQIGRGTEVVNLKGKTLMPGLGDGHFHNGPGKQCFMDFEGGTVDDVLGKLKACLLRDDEVGYLDSNYQLYATEFFAEGMLPSGTQINRHILDRLSADPADDPYGTGTTRPIVILNMDNHKMYTNTKAIENAGFDENTPDPPGGFIGREPDGYPNGQFSDVRGADWGPTVPQPADADYLSKISDYETMNGAGITFAMHAIGSADDLALEKRIADDGELTLRLNQALSAGAIGRTTDPAFIDSYIGGMNALRDEYDGYASPASPGDLSVDTAKMFCDGVAEFPAQTAAMLEDYRINVGTAEAPEWVPSGWRGPDPSCSRARLSYDRLDESKWTIHSHAIGDRAVRDALDNYEFVADDNEPWDRRDQIAHMQFVDDADIPRFGELDVIASMSLQWNQRDAWSVDAIEGYIAPDRMDNMYPARGVVKGGGVVAQGDDWAVNPLGPFTAIEQAVTRTGEVNPARAIYPGPLAPQQSISLAKAVKASTIGVAYQLHREDELGSIAKGKLADLIVTDQNVFKTKIKRVSDTGVLMTMVGGEVVWADPDSPLDPHER
ncbi:MAG: amidohydrolase family protein, partial [Thermoleophilia bacterium]|nr:amidohydrolase family protein [Thermoleophilia bacterium]